MIICPLGMGMVFPFQKPNPAYWTLCDGSWFSKLNHPGLYKVIGGTYGESNDRFQVPDCPQKDVYICIREVLR
jgi:microcystin-dependent protein